MFILLTVVDEVRRSLARFQSLVPDVGSATGAQPLVNQLADLPSITVPGELDRQKGQWMLALSANLGNRDTRLANKSIEKALRMPVLRRA